MHPQNGLLIMLQCKDSDCRKCRPIKKYESEFGLCGPYGVCPGLYKTLKCSGENWLSMSVWNNPECSGDPLYFPVKSGICYTRRLRNVYVLGQNGPNLFNGVCDNTLDAEENPMYYYKYECRMPIDLTRNELRQIPKEQTAMNDVHMNTILGVALLVLVCIMGLIVGYLIRRKRKKTAESNLHMLPQGQMISGCKGAIESLHLLHNLNKGGI